MTNRQTVAICAALVIGGLLASGGRYEMAGRGMMILDRYTGAVIVANTSAFDR